MDLEPSHREPGFLQIGKVDTVRIDDLDEMRILSHAQVVVQVFEDDLDDGIAVGNVFGRKPTAVHPVQLRLVRLRGVVLLFPPQGSISLESSRGHYRKAGMEVESTAEQRVFGLTMV